MNKAPKQIIFFALILAASAGDVARSDSGAELTQESIAPSVLCLRDPTDPESSNAFFIQSTKSSVLIDAGWTSKAQIPDNLASSLASSLKVATHFHYDHIRQWPTMKGILLSERQAKLCKSNTCKLSKWKTVKEVAEFDISGSFKTGQSIESDSGLVALNCGGHSQSDSCYLDTKNRVLFIGDLFYEGPVFYFLPGGSLGAATRSINALLARQDWDVIAQTHGSCRVSRSKLVDFSADLLKIKNRKIYWHWNRQFGFPLWEYKISSGSVLTRPGFR